MEAATGQSGGVLIVLAIIGLVGTLGTAFLATRNSKDRHEKQLDTAATAAATSTAAEAAARFDVLQMRRVEELHVSYNLELARLTAENQRLVQRIQFLEERLDG